MKVRCKITNVNVIKMIIFNFLYFRYLLAWKMYNKTLLLFFLLLTCFSAASEEKSCKEYQSCEAVISDYPNGSFGKKDRDEDGIPCENVCMSIEQVNELLRLYSATVLIREQ